MKHIIRICIGLVLVLAITGCGTGNASLQENETNAEQTMQNTVSKMAATEADSSGTLDKTMENTNGSTVNLSESSQETESVPLAKNWPKDVPVPDGRVKLCMQNGDTPDSGFSAQIITAKTVQGIIDFYMSKFSSVTDEPLKTTGPDEGNQCTGILGDWKVTVNGSLEVQDGNKTGNYILTLLVVKNK